MRRRIQGCLAAGLCAVLFLLAGGSWAVEPDERLTDPTQEARARELGQELRCLVCQNTSIDESNASLARDLRIVLRERIKAGDSDGQVMQYMVQRYGQFVLLKPAFNPVTYLLWLGPPALLIGGLLWLLFRSRRQTASADQPLTAEERLRADHLLGGGTPL